MQCRTDHKVLMIMLDGFGIPPEGWDRSVYSDFCSDDFLRLFRQHSIPLDACLGVDGIPQSATGQSALFCGFNAPQIMGRHIHAFPGKRLRDLIRKQNIFKTVMEHGLKPVFANAYIRYTLEELALTRYRSVTTVMTAATLGWTFNADDLRRGGAVFHDVTNATAPQDEHIPVITPEQAGKNLIEISREHDFTLFEFFLTDRAGHKDDLEILGKVLATLDGFIGTIAASLPADTTLLVTSDHGNSEDLESRIHTRNPVPLLIYGNHCGNPVRITAIDQVYGLILELLGISSRRPANPE